MSDEYDLKPQEPEPTPPPPAAGAGTGGPGFVPPEPIVEGPEEPDEEELRRQDVEKHRSVAAAGYVLFFLPLVLAPGSSFARYHANQGLMLFVTGLGWATLMALRQIAAGLLELIPGFAGPLGFAADCLCMPVLVLLGMGLLALGVVGIVRAITGERLPLPVIGTQTWIRETL